MDCVCDADVLRLRLQIELAARRLYIGKGDSYTYVGGTAIHCARQRVLMTVRID